MSLLGPCDKWIALTLCPLTGLSLFLSRVTQNVQHTTFFLFSQENTLTLPGKETEGNWPFFADDFMFFNAPCNKNGVSYLCYIQHVIVSLI